MTNLRTYASKALSDEQRSLIISFLAGIEKGIHSDEYLKALNTRAMSDSHVQERVRNIFLNEHRVDSGDERFMQAALASIAKATAEHLIEQAMPDIYELARLSDEGLKEKFFKVLELTPECRGTLLGYQDFFQPVLSIADRRGTTVEEVIRSKRN